MPTATRIIVIVLVLTGLFVGVASLRKGQVEGSLTLKSTAALLRAVPELRDEADWKVSFVGTEGIVHGKIGTRSLLEKTAAAITSIERGEFAGLEAVSKLYNGLQFREPAALSISTLRSGSVRVEGRLTASLVERLRPVLRAAVPEGSSIDDRLQVHRELGSVPWEDALLAYVPEFIHDAPGCRLTIQDNRVALGGVVASEMDRERLGGLTVSHLGAAFPFFENRLGIVSDRKPAFATILFVAPDSLRVTGALPTVAAKAALMNHLNSIVPASVTVADELQIDGSLADGEWYQQIAEASRRFFSYAMTAKIGVENNVVTAVVEAVSERGCREIDSAIAGLFPASDFEVTNNIHVAEAGALRIIAAAAKPVAAAPMVPVSLPSVAGGSGSVDAALREKIEGTVIYFKINSAMLGTENISNLKKLGTALAAESDYRVVLRGFTDQGGNARMNQELANLRCGSVRKILRMHGVKEEQVIIEPWSEALMSRDPNEESWKKRRVEMQLQRVAPRTPIASSEEFELRKPLPGGAAMDAPATELEDSIVYFGINSFAIRRSERSKLRAVNSVLAQNPGKDLIIRGFCDKWGNAEYNLYLSKKRCETVKSYLVGLGIEPERMVVDENGSEGADEEVGPSWKRRRVEFQLRDVPRLGAIQ
ncbi:MAG: OmpA family protein [Verrucomicrobiae bacterium]|nr:OmpA family protein [Verrucomicrobiae bacterium]